MLHVVSLLTSHTHSALSNSGCGHPDFQIHCISETPHLTINGVNYRVLDHRDSKITVVNNGVYADQTCPLRDALVNLRASPFTVVSSYLQNLTLLLGCTSTNLYTCPYFPAVDWNTSCQCILDPIQLLLHSPSCNSVVQVPISFDIDQVLREGFEIEWNETDHMFKNCTACEAKEGICGFNASTPFICYEIPNADNHAISRAQRRHKSHAGIMI
ncbi:hypothetical protein KI387_044381, partial [Taxus chinensis]